MNSKNKLTNDLDLSVTSVSLTIGETDTSLEQVKNDALSGGGGSRPCPCGPCPCGPCPCWH
ncbi:hypothetical protein GCM10007414_30320 [Agarivorans gilvus]|uniref:Uncharacterized protein n=1 Tax=Agarivorans gilvus TaxID=680279 RepID=A0ABQ1I5E7_9ALTE|nr:hypothetical protein GCM10007414_30320 [Agarivorans gilvus]